jgi:hypothetical protein
MLGGGALVAFVDATDQGRARACSEEALGNILTLGQRP